MATKITKTVKSSGGDYVSLNAAFAGINTLYSGNLVTADVQVDIVCDGISDTTALSISALTTDATRYVAILPATGAESGSAWRSSGAYTLQPTGQTYVLTGLPAYTQVGRIQVYQPNGGGAAVVNVSTNCGYDGAVAKSAGPSAWRVLNIPLHMRNLIGFGVAAGNMGFTCIGTGTIELDNCLSQGGKYGFETTKTTHVAKNCVAEGYSGTDSAGFGGTGTWNASSTNNASVDATAPGSNPVQSTLANMKFADSANGNFTIDATSTLYDTGADLSGTFTTDINGETRVAWCIGPDEASASTVVNGTASFTQDEVFAVDPDVMIESVIDFADSEVMACSGSSGIPGAATHTAFRRRTRCW